MPRKREYITPRRRLRLAATRPAEKRERRPRFTITKGSPHDIMTRNGLMEWLFYAADVERRPYADIAKEVEVKTGERIEPERLYRLVKRTRADYQDLQMEEMCIERRLQGESVDDVTANLLNRRMMFLAAGGDLNPYETAELLRLMIQKDQLKVRKLEAEANLYKVQAQGAEFVAEVIQDQAKKEDLFRLARDKSLTGSQRIERVRLIVYGAAAVAKPEGVPEMREVIDLQAEAV